MTAAWLTPIERKWLRLRWPHEVTAEQLLDFKSAGGAATRAGLESAVDVGVRYIASWLGGNGAAAIHNLMEDAATAEIARCQVWQWIRNGTKLEDGTALTRELALEFLDDELASVRADLGDGNRLDDAREIFTETALGEKLPSFLTTGAYARYLTDAR